MSLRRRHTYISSPFSFLNGFFSSPFSEGGLGARGVQGSSGAPFASLDVTSIVFRHFQGFPKQDAFTKKMFAVRTSKFWGTPEASPIEFFGMFFFPTLSLVVLLGECFSLMFSEDPLDENSLELPSRWPIIHLCV